MTLRLLCVVSLLGAAALAPLAQPASLAGRVQTTVRPKTQPASAVVYAEPIGATAPRRPVQATMAQQNKSFSPRVLGVPAGSSIDFPNRDSIFHNVFSLSAPEPFDLALYRAGASKTRTFAEPATYQVFCDIHPQMVAFIVVAPTPYVTTVGPDGAWRLTVPTGRYRVTALSERASPVTIDTATSAATPTVLTLDESSASQAPHLNKFGRPYSPASYKDK